MTGKIFYNTCPAAGCHQLCALKVHVEEGRIRKVESADYPGDPAARSVCLKGLAGPRLVYHPDRLKYPPSSMRGWAAIREGKPYPIKVFFNSYRNDLQCDGHLEGYREIFAPMELVVVSDIFMTRTARYADIVLPDATIFERDDLVVNGDYLQLLEKAIEPLHEARTALDVWSELAARVGLGEYFRYTPQDYMRMLLTSGHSSLDGIIFERLEEEKIVRGNLPSPPEIPFAGGIFPTPSGRVEFYNESLVEFGEELPFHRETLESPRRSPLAGRYPLIFLSAKVRATMHSIMANVDWMQEVSEEPMLHINPMDAEKRAVSDGDWVVAFNDRGRVKLKARLSEAVPPGTVNVPHGWWPERFAEGHYSDLLHRIDDLSTIDPVLESAAVVGDSRACSGLIHFDCLAEVVKAQGGMGRKMGDRQYSLIWDAGRCIGCRTCVIACKAENNLERGSWMRVLTRGGANADSPAGTYPALSLAWQPDACRHCRKPPCREACPSEAVYKRPDGIVLIDREKCTGCRVCADACPYDAIRFDPGEGYAQKCTLCSHRIDQGLAPFCVKECICGALRLGESSGPAGLIHGE